MSKSAGTAKTVSTSAPPTFQQPYIDTLLQEAKRLYGTEGPSFYPGATVAPFTPTEQAGQAALKETAGTLGGFWGQGIQPAIEYGLKAFDVSQNPYLAAAAEGAIRPVMQNLTESVLPQIRHGAVATGQPGGSRQQIAEGLATERATRSAMDTTAQMYSNAYQQGLGTMLSTLGLYPQLQAGQLAPGTVMSAVGEQERSMEQAKIDESIARHQWEQALPFQKLIEYANLIKGPFGGLGMSEVQSTGSGSEQTVGAILAGMGIIPQILKWLGIGGG